MDLGIDQLKMKGFVKEGDYGAAWADKVIVQAVVEDERLYAEKPIS
jgi:hypothetical protein